MKVPFNWLAEYVDLSGISPQEVADKLTMGAFEVEEVQLFGQDIQGPLVVGEILEINPHPNANKIRLTKVKVDSSSAPLEIVCGAQNIAVGQLVPVALPGSKVINRHDGSAFPIVVSTIRGVQSNGMLCAASELGLNTNNVDGILILDHNQKYKLGEDVKALLSLEQDHILHVSPRSNRGDALSIRGLAREVAALTKRPLKAPEWTLPTIDAKVKDSTYTIHIEKEADCELFTIRYLTNLMVKESPAFMVRRLEAVGMRSINNIVDISNYVMHEFGQPSHAYDAAKIVGNTFGIRRARNGESLITLDGKERKLTDEVLVITDNKNITGLAGVMGGLDSEVSDTTTALALEAASFQPARVRRGGRLLGLSSEASLRFERGIDPNTTIKASDRAAYLMTKYCCGNSPVSIGPLSIAGHPERKETKVSLRIGQIKRLLDIELDKKEIVQMLKPLGFEPADEKPTASEQLNFLIPSFRQQDVSREIDLIEEVCRMYGYDQIPMGMPHSTIAPPVDLDINADIRSVLSGEGLCEAYISSLVPQEDEPLYTSPELSTKEQFVRVLNPLSKDHSTLRQSLMPGLLRAAKFNRAQGQKTVWLYEIGRIYTKYTDLQKSELEQTIEPETPVNEALKVAGVLTGNKNKIEDSIDFYQAKGIVENLLQRLHIENESIYFRADQLPPPVMHPSKSACIIFDPIADKFSSKSQTHISALETGVIQLGWLGEIHPFYADKFDLNQATYLFELDITALKKLHQAPIFAPIVTSPTISRDLTIDLSQSTEHASIVACIKVAAGTNLKNIELVSIFSLSNNSQSLSYRLTFQHPSETLRSEEVDATIEKIRSTLTQQLSASFRA